MVVVVVSVSRWLVVSCQVPVSVMFGPPVTGRASLAHVSWLLVATSVIVRRGVSIVCRVPLPAVLCIRVTPVVVSCPLWHLSASKRRLWRQNPLKD